MLLRTAKRIANRRTMRPFASLPISSIAPNPVVPDHSRFNLHKPTENRIRPNPPIDVPTIIPNLEPTILNRLHEMQVFGAADFAEYDIAGAKFMRFHGLDGAKLSGLDAR